MPDTRTLVDHDGHERDRPSARRIWRHNSRSILTGVDERPVPHQEPRRHPAPKATRREHQLKRTLGAFDVVMLGIGAIIGAGIFATIGTAAAGDADPARAPGRR